MSENRSDFLLLENQLCFHFYVASKEIIRRYTPFLDKLGITYTQYLALLALWQCEPLSMKELGEKLYLDSGTLTPLLKKMEEMGLLKRRRSEQDERLIMISLSAQGKALKNEAVSIPASLLCKLNLEREEAARLLDQIKLFIKSIEC
jgi:DNA-binding MarR family transcriptional regulator